MFDHDVFDHGVFDHDVFDHDVFVCGEMITQHVCMLTSV